MNLKFGTGGIRATMGPDHGQMNAETIQAATLGVASYALAVDDEPKAAIAYDSRHHSEEFAKETARVLALKGVKAYIFPKLAPTPALSFAVRYLKCTVGVCITASHNPKEYNGYKVYGSDGCQVTSKAADRIQDAIIAADVREAGGGDAFKDYVNSGKIEFIDDTVIKAFLVSVLKKRTKKAVTTDLKVVYTPLNGAGLVYTSTVLKRIGVKQMELVREQMRPDGDFPTCPYPNPEEPAALEPAFKLADETGADIIVANDPDSDRLGVAARKNGVMTRLNGNQVGVLMLDYILRCRKKAGTLPKKAVVVRTIVTTSLTDKIAAAYGAEVIETLTGFKYIGEKIGQLEADGEESRFILGFEESCGYLIGTYARDKDGVGAAMIVCEMADTYKAQGKTLWDALEDIYAVYGRYETTLKSYEFTGDEAGKRMMKIREGLESPSGMVFNGSKVIRYKDYKDGVDGLPASNVLALWTADGGKAVVRPSGTEPKIKVYSENVVKQR